LTRDWTKASFSSIDSNKHSYSVFSMDYSPDG